MFKSAYGFDDETVFYFDSLGNKYVAQGGSFAWHINNPGLVRSHCHFARKNGSIGSLRGFAVFPRPERGRKALSDLLKAKKYYQSTILTIARHYQPDDPAGYLLRLMSYVSVPADRKICSLSKQEFDCLLLALEKLCGYTSVGNESFTLLPRICGHIENNTPPYDSYLITGDILLSKEEVVERILTHRLDGVIVHQDGGALHVRSRPSYSMWNIHMPAEVLPPIDGEIDTIARVVGEKKVGQCIWGFINGIWNERGDALQSAKLISDAANGEQVLSMPNDMLGRIDDVEVCFVLKIGVDTPIVKLAAKFFRYLLSLSEEDSLNWPVIVFVHSMGAIIAEHALELLQHEERQKICIFTFGGGSFIATGKCHPDSHNFASAKDLVCFLGSPSIRSLAMRRYLGFKEGLTQEQIICRWAQEDAMLYVDAIDAKVIKSYEMQRRMQIKKQFEDINNVTIVDSGPNYEHSFVSDCYQRIVQAITERYRKKSGSIKNSASKSYEPCLI
jgi:hypothetical protein